MEPFLPNNRVINSRSIRTIRITASQLVKLAREQSFAETTKWGGVPSDAELVSLQVKEGKQGDIFHIFRLWCSTSHPEQLPWDVINNRPAENLYLFAPGSKQSELLKEVHNKDGDAK